MSFKFIKSNCVAVGTFNIYIIQPSLLSQMGVVTDKVGSFSGDFTQPGWRFNADGATWIVRPERLSVESSDPAFDCGNRISSVLRILAWTPVVAVGTNVVFRAEASFENDLPGHFRLPKADGHELCSRSSEVVLKDGDREIHINLKSTGASLELQLNTHSNFMKTPRDANIRQIVQNENARNACDRFMQDRVDSVRLAQSILGGEFSWDRLA